MTSPKTRSIWTRITLPGGDIISVPGPALTHVDDQLVLIRDGGGEGRPVLLVHGWCADSLTNWHRAYEPLREAGYRPIGLDLPGHGGTPLVGTFHLRMCAQIVASLAGTLSGEYGMAPLAVGYSMGGPVLQLSQRAVPNCLAGVTYAATAARVISGWNSRSLGALSSSWGLAAEAAGTVRRVFLRGAGPAPSAGNMTDHVRWLAGSCDLRALARAGHSLAYYDSTSWVGRAGTPAASIITLRDRAVAPDAQRELARLVGAEIHELDFGHTACLRAEFGTAVASAVIGIELAGQPRGLE